MPCTHDRPKLSLLHTGLPITLIAVLAAGIFHQAGFMRPAPPEGAVYEPATVVVPARSYSYRSDGEFLKGTAPIDAPMKTVVAGPSLTIMKNHVAASEYRACVSAGACRSPEAATSRTDVPATGVSFDDATTYARWLSEVTGEYWTLPTDEQLAQAAGKRFPDDALGLDPDSKNPALRWLADYEREARERAAGNPTLGRREALGRTNMVWPTLAATSGNGPRPAIAGSIFMRTVPFGPPRKVAAST